MSENDDKYRAALAALKEHGSKNKAAKALGMPRTTLRRHIDKAALLGLSAESPISGIEIEDIPSGDLPVEEILEMRERRFRRAKRHQQAKKWRKVKIPSDLPYAIALVGDVHIDDDGCNIPALRSDLKTMAETDGMYAVNLGDSHNGWPWAGRLARLYADQDTSRATAIRMVEWLFAESGVTWAAIILGNHDLFVGDGDILKFLGRGAALTTEKWLAELAFVTPNGSECRLAAAHDWPGQSIYNPIHGPMRKVKFGGGDLPHIVACGHKHNWAIFQHEDPEKDNFIYHAVKSRGYKFLDDYAKNLGLQDQHHGMTITAVVNPGAATPASFVHCFADVREAADFLTWLRQRK